MKNKLKSEGYSKNSKKRQRLLDSDEDEIGLNHDGVLPLGKQVPNNKQYDDWNLAKKELSDMLAGLTQMNSILMGVGVPNRHYSYIFGRPPEKVSKDNGREHSNNNDNSYERPINLL